MADTAIHSSEFDVRGVYTLSVPAIGVYAEPAEFITPIKISIPVKAYANKIELTKNYVGVTIKPQISAYTDALDYDIGRGDCYFDVVCYAPSMLVKVTPGTPNSKTVEFGNFTFSHAKRGGPDAIAVGVDERFARFGVNEPKIYTRTITIVAESDDYSEFGRLNELYGLRRSLNMFGFPYPDAYISNISELQRLPGLSRWLWEVEFTYHKFESVDVAIIDGMTLPTVISVSEEKKTAILDDIYVRAGVNEPLGYMSSRTVEFVDYHGEIGGQLSTRIGKAVTININGEIRERVKLSNIVSQSPKGGGLINIFQIELQWYTYNTTDTVKFGNITLSNPFFPNSHDISPEYSVDMSSGFSITNPIPVVTTRYAAQCLTESAAEVDNLVNAIGTKQTLTINGTAIPLCFITSLSKLQPKGGGNVWKYTIEFGRKVGENPIVVTFNGIALPNATESGEEEIEILSNRTTLKSGKIAVDIGQYASKRFSFTCMSNTRTEYNQLYNLIAQKKVLVVDGDTINKAYISSLSGNRKIGSGTSRLYTYTIEFEEETA